MTPLLEIFVVFRVLIEANPQKESPAQYLSVLLKVSFTSEMCMHILKNNLHAVRSWRLTQSILHLFTSIPHDPTEKID